MTGGTVASMRTKALIPAVAVTAALVLGGCGGSGDSSDGGSKSSTTEASDVTLAVEPVEIPADFPEALDPPKGATVTQATTVGEAGTSFLVKASLKDAEAAFEAYQEQVSKAGYEVVGAEFTPSPMGGYGGFSARGTDYTAAITFGPDETGKASILTINVAPAA